LQAQVTQTEARQQTRDQTLKALLSKMEKQKAPLPKPLSLIPLAVRPPGQGSSLPNNPTSKVLLPAEDLKPLYDFAVECRECQARLTAAQADLKDERSKTQILGRKRDDARRVARGGSVLQRVVRATKWVRNRRRRRSGRRQNRHPLNRQDCVTKAKERT
jgi:hypothetical protein